jgi:hypothetical protein
MPLLRLQPLPCLLTGNQMIWDTADLDSIEDASSTDNQLIWNRADLQPLLCLPTGNHLIWKRSTSGPGFIY